MGTLTLRMDLNTLANLLNKHGKSSFNYWDRDTGEQNLVGTRTITASVNGNSLAVHCEEQLKNFTRTTDFAFEPYQVQSVIPVADCVTVGFDPVITAQMTSPKATGATNQFQFYFDDQTSAQAFYAEIIK